MRLEFPLEERSGCSVTIKSIGCNSLVQWLVLALNESMFLETLKHLLCHLPFEIIKESKGCLLLSRSSHILLTNGT